MIFEVFSIIYQSSVGFHREKKRNRKVERLINEENV